MVHCPKILSEISKSTYPNLATRLFIISRFSMQVVSCLSPYLSLKLGFYVEGIHLHERKPTICTKWWRGYCNWWCHVWHNTLYTSFLLTCAKWGSVNWTQDSFLKSWGKYTIHTTWDMTWQGFFTESGLKFIHAPLTLQHQGILALEVMTADWSQTSYGWSRRPGWNRPPRRRSRPLLRRRGMLSESERRMGLKRAA